jgi:hypothetical protein
MKKTGRNEPCHCGSGKKYKKCCEQKDELAAIAASKLNVFGSINDDFDDFDDDLSPVWHSTIHDHQLQNGETAALRHRGDEIDAGDSTVEETATTVIDDDEDNFDDEDEFDDDFDDAGDNEDFVAIDGPYPKISDADQKLVDQWWDIYQAMGDLDPIQTHLNDFISSRPDLVENLGLEHEMLFELGGQYESADRVEEYIAFLMDFRQRFPSTYVRSAGWYDKDIISWLIIQGRSDEISNYTNYFTAYPIAFYGRLVDLLQLMLATNVTQEMLSLLHSVAARLDASTKIVGAQWLLQSLVADVYARHLKVDSNKDDVRRFLQEANDTLPMEMDLEESVIDEWLHLMQTTTRPFAAWTSILPSRADDREVLIGQIGQNFAYYLLNQVNISWVTARHYNLTLSVFLLEYWKIAHKKNSTYIFQPQRIHNVATSVSDTGLFSGPVKHITILNALYYFVDYLVVCGNLEPEQRQKIQATCSKLADNLLDQSIEDSLEISCFEQFPIFGTIK